MKRVVVMLVLLLGLAVNAQAANLLTNGDFQATPSALGSGSWTIYSGTFPGWTLADSSHQIEIQHGMFGGNNPSKYAELDAHNNNVLSQSVNLVHGASYLLSYDYFNRTGSSSSSMSVLIGSLSNPVYSTSNSAVTSQWVTYTDSFVYSGPTGSAIFSLVGTGQSDSYGALVDNVSLTQTSKTPIPGAALLLGSGLVGLAGWRKRRNG